MAKFTDFIPMQKELQQTKADLAAARSEIERLTARAEKAEAERDDLAAQYTKSCQVIDNIAAERDKTRAQVAGAFEAAARLPQAPNWRWRFEPPWSAGELSEAIRALTPADAKSALEAYGREKVREGMKRAADIAGQHTAILPHYNDITRGYANGRSGARDAILAAMEKETGE